MTRRPGVLISAAVTVAIPGALTVLAVLAQHHPEGEYARSATAAAGKGVTAAAGKGTALGPFPVAPPTAHAAVRDSVAATQRTSGAPVTVLKSHTGGQQALGSRLLGKAADAGQSTSYQGVQVLSQSGMDGTVTMVAHVWHRGGGLTLTQTSNDARRAAPQTAVSYDPNNRSPEGVFGLTRSLVALLDKHYVAIYQGNGSALGRSAEVVAVYRFDGSLAARFWIDRRTQVPLRRELFNTSDQLISKEQFVNVRFGGTAGKTAVSARAQTIPSWATARSPSRLAETLADRGLRLPGSLPGGLPLQSAQSTGTGTGRVVAFEYSDGLYVDSLFVQRGTLAPDMTGWRPVKLGGHQVYVSGRSVTWAGNGHVYTMVTDAPRQTVARDIAAVSPDGSPGFLARLGRGLSRLASLANPFG